MCDFDLLVVREKFAPVTNSFGHLMCIGATGTCSKWNRSSMRKSKLTGVTSPSMTTRCLRRFISVVTGYWVVDHVTESAILDVLIVVWSVWLLQGEYRLGAPAFSPEIGWLHISVDMWLSRCKPNQT